MVHIQNSPVSATAVVSTLRFKNVAYKTISFTPADRVSLPEPPEGRHFSWISEHGLEESPHDHEEEYMQYCEYFIICVMLILQLTQHHCGIKVDHNRKCNNYKVIAVELAGP